MAASKFALLESRIIALEAELSQLKYQQMNGGPKSGLPGDEWIEKIYGSFADDPDYEKAMELGRQYRESLRPKPTKKRRIKSATQRKR